MVLLILPKKTKNMKHLDYKELFENNEQWINEKLKTSSTFFDELASSQSPDYLMIGCSDSRVPLSSIMKAKAGEFFVHRNIANQVGLTDMNTLSVLEYSVDHLHIKHIIVIGHYRCGGVGAAVDGVDQGLIENWIAPIKELYIKNKQELDSYPTRQASTDRLSELNVIEQTRNIFRTPILERAFNRKNFPKIHGWIFDIYNGKIKELELPIEKWKKEGIVPECY